MAVPSFTARFAYIIGVPPNRVTPLKVELVEGLLDDYLEDLDELRQGPHTSDDEDEYEANFIDSVWGAFTTRRPSDPRRADEIQDQLHALIQEYTN